MKLMDVINSEQYKSAKYGDYVDIICSHCQKPSKIKKHHLQISFCKNNVDVFCSCICASKIRSTPPITYTCLTCNKPFINRHKTSKKAKSKNRFCSTNCAGIYNNKHKTYGFIRSKLEIYIESVFKIKFPNLNIIYNDRSAIGSELDIYIPELKFAVELNGIVHYEPIYGNDRLNIIRNKDNQKIISCYEIGVELMIIDTTHMKKFNPINANKYVTLIEDQINKIIAGG